MVKAVELLAKNVESGFQAMEARIKRMGEDFTRKIQLWMPMPWPSTQTPDSASSGA